MLSELRHVRQVKGEGFRRWFRDPYFDLIVWYQNDGRLLGFQLCYDRQGRERAFTWWKDRRHQHGCVDEGEVPGRPPMSPVIVTDDDADFPSHEVAERFLRESAHLDPEIALLVFESIIGCGSRLAYEEVS